MWRVILILSTAQVSGCAAKIDGDYCDIARPMYFDTVGTISWLADNDPRLLAATVSHNEVHREFCDG